MMLHTGLLHNFPVTSTDLLNATHIYGMSVPLLKGKTTRSTPIQVKGDLIPVVPEMMDSHGNVTIGMDIMFINKLPFIFTIAENIAFTMIDNIVDCSMKSITATI